MAQATVKSDRMLPDPGVPLKKTWLTPFWNWAADRLIIAADWIFEHLPNVPELPADQ